MGAKLGLSLSLSHTHTKERIQIGDFWEQGAEENILK